MSISWGDWDVRVHAAEAWISLAPRFAAEQPVIVDQIEAVLADPVPAVRFQAARNLQVICLAAPERMWAMGERIATRETNTQIVATYLNHSLRRFSHSDPERCEAVLSIVKGRLDGDVGCDHLGREHVQESLGRWTAQLFAKQGRALARIWLDEWAADPERYSTLLNSFASSLREMFFLRYSSEAEAVARAMCDRAQEGLALILTLATRISGEAYSVLVSDAGDADNKAAGQRYSATVKVIGHAMNQLYFGSGAHATDREVGAGLPTAAAMAHFINDYPCILAVLSKSREPAILHRLIELYEFLIPGDPVTVFETIHGILTERGKEEGYHYESLGNSAVVGIVQRYIANYRAIFEDEGRRTRLVAILRLFSEVGWPEALKLLYDLPDLLR